MNQNEVYVTECPLGLDAWKSDPEPTEGAAKEARRKHLANHRLGELVDFIETLAPLPSTYERKERPTFRAIGARLEGERAGAK